MNAYALHEVAHDARALRWGTSASAVIALHAALIALAITWYRPLTSPGAANAKD